MKTLLYVLAVLSLLYTPYAAAQSIQSEWQNSISETRKHAKIIGLGGAIMQNGKIITIAVDGNQIKGNSSPITNSDLWHIGSITKSMTATMIGRLVEKDKMQWDMRVADVFKDVEIHTDWRNITLDQLLTHTSGVRPNFPIGVMLNWPDTQAKLDQARVETIHTVLKAPLNTPPNAFSYSNVGYTIAGVMAAQITGKSWEVLMQEEVFAPLGLSSAGFGAPLSTRKTSQPWGHRKVFGIMKIAMDPTQNADNTPIIGPAGTVNMSLLDMLRYGNAHMQGERAQNTNEKSYLSPQTWKRLHTKKLNDYAYGWIVPKHRKWANGKVIWHNGSNTMWYTMIAIAPEKNVIFALSTNDGDSKSADKAFANLVSNFGKPIK